MADKEYIERAALEKFIKDGLNNPDKSKAFGYDAIEILAEIHYTPPADVAEVVRCKDCKHYKQNPWNKETDMLCQCYSDWHATEPNDFCSYEERRTTC